MEITIVNDYFFKPGGDVAEGKAAAVDLLAYFREEVPQVQLSLWLENRENPLHHYHITVFDDREDVIQSVRESRAPGGINGDIWLQSPHNRVPHEGRAPGPRKARSMDMRWRYR